MQIASDLMLILELDPESKAVLLAVAQRLGCEHVETDSVENLSEVLSVRRPTLAVLAVDRVDTDCLAVLDALAEHEARPMTVLIGSVGPRVLSSARRAAESRGLSIVGVGSRPLDAIAMENLLAPHLVVAPPVQRAELEQAIAEHELMLFYQPKLSITGARVEIRGVEALIRWQHPRRGVLHPRHFLKAINECALTAQLTDFVMTEAVRQSSQWRALGVALEIIINLSTHLVQDRGFPDRLAVLLQENDCPPQQVVLDVTESLNVDDQNLLLDVFTRLRILGVGLSLDNFGTGMSSLTELYKMPFSEIKVDHSLLADVPREREARVIVKAIVNLAHSLNLSVCAVGVETRQMFEFVRSAGFDTVQGRFFCEPVKAQDIAQIVRSWPVTGPAAAASWRPEKPLDFDGSATMTRTPRIRRADGKIAL